MTGRREALRQLLTFVAGSPLYANSVIAAQQEGTLYPPTYSEEVNGPVSLHEIEEAAKKKVHKLAYDFIAGGVEDEVTLRANREALNRIFLRPRVMVDVSKIDPSVELLGTKMDFPILLAPTGGKNLVIPDGDRIAAQGAAATKTALCRGEWCVDEQAGRKRAGPLVVAKHNRSKQQRRCGGLCPAFRGFRLLCNLCHGGQPVSVQPRTQQSQPL